PVTVPNVVGLSQAAATTSLTGAGLTVGGITFGPSATVPNGNVISQTPAAGSSIAGGSAVALVVSTGTPPTIATSVSSTVLAMPGKGTTVTSPVFPVAAKTLLVAFISADGPPVGPGAPATARQNVDIMTSVPALTWTRAAQDNAQSGTSEVWYAFATAAQAPTSVTAITNKTGAASMTVVGFTGAATTLAGGASAVLSKATGVAGDPSLTITTKKANSLVFGVG